MIPLTDEEIKSYKGQKVYKYITYAKVGFVMIKIRKANLNVIIKSEIIAITSEDLEKLLIVFEI